MNKQPRIVVIDSKTNLHSGYNGKVLEGSFKPMEPISSAFIETFRRDPKGTLDNLENSDSDAFKGPQHEDGSSAYVAVGKFTEGHAAKVGIGWDKLDAQRFQAISDGVMGSLMCGQFENALIGLSYLVYQNRIHVTNKAEFFVEDPASAYLSSEDTDPPERA